MKLNDYLKENCPRAFSEKMGVDYSTVWHWRRGNKIPRKEHIIKIQEITNDAVRPEDFYK